MVRHTAIGLDTISGGHDIDPELMAMTTHEAEDVMNNKRTDVQTRMDGPMIRCVPLALDQTTAESQLAVISPANAAADLYPGRSYYGSCAVNRRGPTKRGRRSMDRLSKEAVVREYLSGANGDMKATIGYLNAIVGTRASDNFMNEADTAPKMEMIKGMRPAGADHSPDHARKMKNKEDEATAPAGATTRRSETGVKQAGAAATLKAHIVGYTSDIMKWASGLEWKRPTALAVDKVIIADKVALPMKGVTGSYTPPLTDSKGLLDDMNTQVIDARTARVAHRDVRTAARRMSC